MVLKRSLPLALLCVLAVAPAMAQVRVTTLAKVGKALQTTREIRLARFADLTETDSLSVGEELADGDLLTARSPDLFVELTCRRGTLLRLTGAFRMVINAPETADCGLDPLNGGVDVLTDQPTEIGLGGKTLGTKGTRYAIRLSRGPSGPGVQVLVFEGQVELKEGDRRQLISTSQSLTLSRRMPTAEPQPVTPEEIQRWAGLYAHFDLVKAEAAGVTLTGEQQAATQTELTRLHAAVLQDPAAQQPRVELARAQVANRVGDEALYNLKHIPSIDRQKLEQIQPEKLQKNDPTEYRRFEKILREAPPTVRRIDTLKTTPVVTPPPGGSE